MQFFTVYRKNWRNESSHNYKLFFNESEVLLAITSVSSFTYVLLNQILESLAFQTIKTENIDIEKLKKIIDNSDVEIEDKIISLIKMFISENIESLKDENLKEFEFIGLFNGFISSFPKIIVQREPKIDDNHSRPDMIIELNKIRAIIEFNRKRNKNTKELNRTKIIKYLWTTDILIGILFYFNLENIEEIKVNKNILTDGDDTFKIIEIY